MNEQRVYVVVVLIAVLSFGFLQAQQAESSKATIKNPEEFVKFATIASPYEILGVPDTADKKIINKASSRLRSKFRLNKWPGQEEMTIKALKIIADASKAALGESYEGPSINESLIGALVDAAGKNNIDLVKELLKNGVHVNAKARQGETALISASVEGNVAMVKVLLAIGANPLLEGKTFVGKGIIIGTPRDITIKQLEAMHGWACLNTDEEKKKRKKHLARRDEVIKILEAAEENWLVKRMGLPEKALEEGFKTTSQKEVLPEEVVASVHEYLGVANVPTHPSAKQGVPQAPYLAPGTKFSSQR